MKKKRKRKVKGKGKGKVGMMAENSLKCLVT